MSTRKDEQLPKELTYQPNDFDQSLSNFLLDAWEQRSHESPLYMFYNHIYVTECATLYYPDQPRVSIGTCPQPLFGTPGPVATNDKLESAEKNAKPLPPQQRPDSARFLVFSDRGKEVKLPAGITNERILVCFQENKTLNISDAWWTDKAHNQAGLKLKANLLQVFDAAMAAFAHKPDLKRVHAVLLIGPFFTHIAWTSRPTEEQLKPIEVSPLPKGNKKLQGRAYDILIGSLLEEISHYEARKLPDEIYFYNEPVVNYLDLKKDDDYQDVCLSPEFLWTLASPVFKHYPQIKHRTSMFVPPSRKPRVASLGVALEVIKEAIIDGPIEDVQQKLNSLGHGSTTPTPPTSAAKRDPYKPTGSTKAARAQPPLQTRARATGAIPGLE